MLVRKSQRYVRELQPGVQHAVLSYNDQLMLCEVHLAKGTTVASHEHPHVQIIYVVKGRINLTCAEGEITLEAGDSYLASSNEPHAVKALEDAIVLDIFSPARADFIAALQR